MMNEKKGAKREIDLLYDSPGQTALFEDQIILYNGDLEIIGESHPGKNGKSPEEGGEPESRMPRAVLSQLAKYQRDLAKDVARTGRGCVFEKELRHEGKILISEISTFPIFKKNNSLRKIVQTVRDITGRKELGEKITASKNTLQGIFDGIQDGILLVDRRLKLIAINQSQADFLGEDIKSLVGKNFNTRLKRLWEACNIDLIQETLDQEKEIYEERDVVMGGSKYVVHVSTFPIRDSRGEVTRVIQHIKDLTEKKAREMKIRCLKEFNENIVAGLPSSIVALDRHLIILSANQTFYDTFQVDRSVNGKNFRLVFDPIFDDSKALVKRIENVLKTGARQSIDEIPYRHPLGEEKIFDVQILGLKPSRLVIESFIEGMAVLVVVLTDMTERKIAEQRMKESEKLIAVGELAAGVAHEIRNPLTVIDGSVQYCLNKFKMSRQLREYLEIIQQNAAATENVISQLLDYTLPKKINYMPTTLDQITQKSLSLLKSEALRHRIKIVLDLPGDLPPLNADPNQLHQVFVNLFLNAMQAMPEGGAIKVSAKREALKNLLVVQVSDTGTGMDRETLTKIFNPFFSAGKKGRSTGLGLAVCQRIMLQHKGAIFATSELNKGSTFYLEFPLTGQD